MTFWQTLDASEKALALQATVGAGMRPAAAARLLGTSPSAVAGHLHMRPDSRRPAIRGARGARILLRIIAVRKTADAAPPPAGGDSSPLSDPAPAPAAPVADVAAAVPPSAATSAAPPSASSPAKSPPIRSRAGATARGWSTGFGRAKNAVSKSVAQDLAALAAAAIDAGKPVKKCPPAHADGSVLTSYDKIGR